MFCGLRCVHLTHQSHSATPMTLAIQHKQRMIFLLLVNRNRQTLDDADAKVARRRPCQL